MADDIEGGFGIAWIAQAFRMNEVTVRRRLADVPIKRKEGKGNKYDIAAVAPYLVKPNINWDQHMRNLRKADLPANLQKEIWDARLKEAKFRLEAGELWHTKDVVDKFTEVFLALKANLQLWPDVVERQIGLTDEQRELMTVLGDALLDNIHGEIKAKMREATTSPFLKDFDEDIEREDKEAPNLDLI